MNNITPKQPRPENEVTELMTQTAAQFAPMQFTYDRTWAYNGQLHANVTKQGSTAGGTGHVDIYVDGKSYGSKEGRISGWVSLPFDLDDLELAPQYADILAKVVERTLKAAAHAQKAHQQRKQEAAAQDVRLSACIPLAEEGDL